MTGEQRGGKWQRESNTGARRGGGGQRDSEFVNLELSKEQKQELRATYTSLDELDAALEGVLQDGTKITVKWDERNTCYAAFAFASDDSDNAGFILTGRGGAASRALRELVYKHTHILEGIWPSYHNHSRGGEDEDW